MLGEGLEEGRVGFRLLIHMSYLGNPRGEFGAVAGCASGFLCASSNVSMETKKRYLNSTPYVL